MSEARAFTDEERETAIRQAHYYLEDDATYWPEQFKARQDLRWDATLRQAEAAFAELQGSWRTYKQSADKLLAEMTRERDEAKLEQSRAVYERTAYQEFFYVWLDGQSVDDAIKCYGKWKWGAGRWAATVLSKLRRIKEVTLL